MKNKKTWCGRCGKQGVYRKTTDLDSDEIVYALYVCSNPECDKVESIVIKAFGSLSGPCVGTLETLSKKTSNMWKK